MMLGWSYLNIKVFTSGELLLQELLELCFLEVKLGDVLRDIVVTLTHRNVVRAMNTRERTVLTGPAACSTYLQSEGLSDSTRQRGNACSKIRHVVSDSPRFAFQDHDQNELVHSYLGS